MFVVGKKEAERDQQAAADLAAVLGFRQDHVVTNEPCRGFNQCQALIVPEFIDGT